jgi:hypothetical protein
MIFLPSCKKYEEDNHFITLRKPTNRIIGSYELKEIVLNNFDCTDSISQLWGRKTIFEFTDIHFFHFNYSNQSNPIEQLDTKSLIVKLDDELLVEYPYLPKIYRGSYFITNRNKGVRISLYNPIDLITANFSNSIDVETYQRSINNYYIINKLDKDGMILTRDNGDRIVFERIE